MMSVLYKGRNSKGLKTCEIKNNAKYQANAIIKRKISNWIDFLRFAKESIFSGLNNLTVNSVMDEEYDSFFGFTENEVKDMLRYYGVSDKEEKLKEWYDGYLFGGEEIYNPWSVINYISKGCRPQVYWVNTGKMKFLMMY